jgi:flagellar motor switch protein FliN/FliY
MEPRDVSLIEMFVEELGNVVRALVDTDVAVRPVGTAVKPHWVIRLDMNGGATGSVTLALPEAETLELARRIMGFDSAPPPEAVADTVQELAAQACGGVNQRIVGKRLAVGDSARANGVVPITDGQHFGIAVGADLLIVCGLWDQAVASDARPAAPAPAPPPAGRTKGPGENLELILDIELPLTVRFGCTEMTLQALTRLGPGSVIDLDRSPDDPVEMLVNGTMVARGEVVVVGGNYGVRITEVVSPADRIRSFAQ